MEHRGSLSGAFIGEGTLLVRCAEAFLSAGQHVALLVTANPVIQGWADEHGVPYVASQAELAAYIADRPVDYLFSVTNLDIIGDDVLRLPRKMAINFHDALLPTYAGMHATSWALMNRERVHGVTWHEMLSALDAGRVLKQRAVDITAGETAYTLNAKCYEAGAEAFAELVLELVSGTFTAVPQELSGRSYYGRHQRPEAACTLGWQRPAEDLAALVAALAFGPTDNPLGLAKFELEDGTVLLAREAAVLATQSEAPPGTIIEVADGMLKVTTASADLVLRGLQTSRGEPVQQRDGLAVGRRLPCTTDAQAERLTAIHTRLGRHETYWRSRMTKLESIELPYATRAASVGN